MIIKQGRFSMYSTVFYSTHQQYFFNANLPDPIQKKRSALLTANTKFNLFGRYE